MLQIVWIVVFLVVLAATAAISGIAARTGEGLGIISSTASSFGKFPGSYHLRTSHSMDLLLEQIQGLDEALRLLQADVRIVQTENWELRKALVHLHVQSDAIRSEGTATAHSDDRAAVATSSNAGDYPDDLQSALDTYKSQLKKKMKAFTRTLTEEVQSIANQVRSNSDTLTEWSQRLHCIDSSSNKDQLTFKGCNVYISNGMGMTGSDNGRGNMILGYNEAGNGPTLLPTDRNGSHNLIVGPGHRYTSHGSILAGVAHSVSGEYSSCIAGEYNTVTASYALAAGGISNAVSGTFGVAASGTTNNVAGAASMAAGGYRNVVSDAKAVVAGGEHR